MNFCSITFMEYNVSHTQVHSFVCHSENETLFAFPKTHGTPNKQPKLLCLRDPGMNIWSQVWHIHKRVEEKQTPCTFFQLYLIIQCHNVVTHGESGYDWIGVISEWNCTQVLPWALGWLLNGPASPKEEFVLQTNFANA